MAEAKPPTPAAVAAARKDNMYYPFRENLFNKRPQYKGLKYKYMGIARGLHWRQGFPTTKMGIYAGNFKSSGRKNRVYKTRQQRRDRANDVCAFPPITVSSP